MHFVSVFSVFKLVIFEKTFKTMSPSFVAIVVIITTLAVLIGIFIDISKK